MTVLRTNRIPVVYYVVKQVHDGIDNNVRLFCTK